MLVATPIGMQYNDQLRAYIAVEWLVELVVYYRTISEQLYSSKKSIRVVMIKMV